ncbi:MAG: sialate O-acetylesterase [Bacteroidales bacterium]|nr:sialate O-acetylesterase [Candidatus Cryptobacteroides aphodequi]
MKRILTALLLLCASAVLRAETTLPALFGDNMVLQQQTQARIWGFSDAASVGVTASWDGKTVKAPVSDGRWDATLSTPKAGGPYEITIDDGYQTLKVKNVFIGEVWICSGQSNMAMTLAGYGGQPAYGGYEEIFHAGRYKDMIHVFSCGANEGCERPLDDLPSGEWKAFGPQTAQGTSAVAYYFAKHVTEVLGVPVGIICNAVGGAAIEAWMSPEMVSRVKGVDYSVIDNPRSTQARRRLARLWNMWMSPIVGYTAKGFLWYQGEYNVRTMDPVVYGRMMTEMVRSYREFWGNDKMPFYYTQIAPYFYNDCGEDGIELPLFVEQQLECLKTIPNSGIAGTTDIGEARVIHPCRKDLVGWRLAMLALTRTYKILPAKNFPDGPFIDQVSFEGSKASVTFKGATGGLSIGVPIEGFELAGADKVFHKADAVFEYDRTHITVTCPEVAQPVALRYAFRNVPQATLRSSTGCPVFPFRTDNWQ